MLAAVASVAVTLRQHLLQHLDRAARIQTVYRNLDDVSRSVLDERLWLMIACTPQATLLPPQTYRGPDLEV